MKTTLIVVCVVLGMALLGWLTFTNSPDQTTIHIETQKIKSDTRRAVHESEKVIDEVQSKSQEILKPHPSS